MVTNQSVLHLIFICRLDYEVAELTWENGQIAMHGLGPPRVPGKHLNTTTAPSKYTWEKPRAGGTLESIVNQATRLPLPKPPFDDSGGGAVSGAAPARADGVEELVPWFDHHRAVAAAGTVSSTTTMDALVPCSKPPNDNPISTTGVVDSEPGIGTCVVGSSTRVGSCSGAATQDENAFLSQKRARVARVGSAPEWSSRPDPSVSASATFGRDSQQVTLETCDRDLGMGFTSTSLGSAENTSSGMPCTKATTADDHDSVCHSRAQVMVAKALVYIYIIYFM